MECETDRAGCMPKFTPEELAVDAVPVIRQATSGDAKPDWRPLFRHECTFNPVIFQDVMLNLIKNPNINSSWLFRADILHDTKKNIQNGLETPLSELGDVPDIPSFDGFGLHRCLIRRLIPRSTMRDKPMDQTCLIYQSKGSDSEGGLQRHLVIYLPHVSTEAEMPYYHPTVRGIAFHHEWSPTETRGSVSVSYLYFEGGERPEKLTRIASHLLQAVYKHGQGRADGYQKRVHHDLLVPQARVQNTYTALKQKYARALIESWVEITDPTKHVFEDLCIAAFLIELWTDIYGRNSFPGFVDIGCGNGLLVHILNLEGFKGWGFDARSRKSWATYSTRLETPTGVQESLQQLVLLPPPVSRDGISEISSEGFREELVHDGRFPKGTFIISNHADELTPWTPILAAISDCPFIMIPCCSHDLTGARFRAPAPKDKKKANSAYSSLVSWVTQITADCGWVAEQEMLRIPSTRNTAIVGRKRQGDVSAIDIGVIVDRYGGTAGYLETVVKLVKSTNLDEKH
ncbi:hypothetical protein NEUTE1DRAFT_89496 [Neurospora tetrasperma FGSC 2508]|uniref:tRNA (uracil-O(2)-)-methyltransferase n=1 Tax=Neurospora tetrasperma (strain FGSC 2508 / ATCC MYA-4615 / P0657) TaxID=510951 RepID=F8N3S4_NEUT8|nr:uncharacterized protein NEUTE1DRAFT_89496 [Neurospora tetrasperma FGSC 2508]EGO51774.1 hypothetical protein NEUTE1DRAFT_89496 [Neurospora tetrasperma FGSC 2508]